MQKLKYIRLILFLLFCTCNYSYAQKKSTKIELKQANTFLYDETKGSKTKKLVGDVIFKHESTYIYCDSAYIYENNSVDAYGKVKINEGDTLFAYGDTLKYEGNTRKAQLHRNVKLQDKEITLTTDHLYFDFNNNTGNYYTGGKIIESNNVLTSKKGYYYSKKKQFFFKENVKLVNPQYTMTSDTLLYQTVSGTARFIGPSEIKSNQDVIYCENGWYDTRKEISQFSRNAKIITKEQVLTGDSIYYNRLLGIGKAFKNVEITDTTENIIINGDYAITYEKENRTFVTGNALMSQIQEKDTFFLHADTLLNITDSASQRTLFAFHHVKFYKTDLKGKCDSMVYAFSDSLAKLFKDPVIWAEENQLTAGFIELKTSNKGIQSIFMKDNSMIISQEDTTRYNQIKGKDMTGYFVDNELSKIIVTGNGQTIYYAKEDNGSMVGVNRADCSNMLILLKDNEVDKISFYTKPVATFFPINELKPEELRLQNFNWRVKRNHSQKRIFFPGKY